MIHYQLPYQWHDCVINGKTPTQTKLNEYGLANGICVCCTDQLSLSPMDFSLAQESSLDLWFIGLSVIFMIICLVRVNTHLLIKLPKHQAVISGPVWFLHPFVNVTACMLACCCWKNLWDEKPVGDCGRSSRGRWDSLIEDSRWGQGIQNAATKTNHLSPARLICHDW